MKAFIVSALVAAVASAQVSHVSHIGHGIHHGRIQTVTYTADHTNGYVPVVEFAGAAAFPPAPAGGYVGEPGAAPYSGPYALPYEATLPGYAVAAAAAPAYAPAA